MGEQVEEQTKNKKELSEKLSWPVLILCIVGAILSTYIFLLGLGLMGTAFKVLGGRGAGNMYSAVDNPVSGLMTGILSTVLVQSSSTSTSIVVAMVADGGLQVRQGIPIIMGANIGTSVTNSIVSMGFAGDRIMLERAFGAATVHDMFNMLTVLTLLPIEAIVAAIQGEGGPLYWLTKKITESLMGSDKGEPLFTSPVKAITKPITNAILKANKYVIYALTLSPPEAKTPVSVNTTLCNPLGRRLSENLEGTDEGSAGQRSLLSKRAEQRRLTGLEDCSSYYCITKNLDKQFKKISSSSYEKLTNCSGFITDYGSSGGCSEKCYLDAGSYYDEKVTNGRLVKGGFLEGAGDAGGGIIGLILSILLLCIGLLGLVKCLQTIFMGNAKRVLRYATKLNDYLAILIGLGVTIVVQSSSVTTSALTPLCGVGVLPIEKMLPMTLGANIGTTCTALIASLVSLKFGAVQIALCHLLFNIIGILIWFPVPPMRRIPLEAAKLLGLYASFFKWFPIAYILCAFVALPGICLLIGTAMEANVAVGVILLILVLAGLGTFEFLWLRGLPEGTGPPALQGALCYKVLSQEQREEGKRELQKANDELMGTNLEPEPNVVGSQSHQNEV